MPLLPPVTSAIFPSSLPIYFLLSCHLFTVLCEHPRFGAIGYCIENLVRQIVIVDCASHSGRDAYSLCFAFRISAARSPMMTQGAMVLPVVTRGMIDPSAMRRLSMP